MSYTLQMLTNNFSHRQHLFGPFCLQVHPSEHFLPSTHGYVLSTTDVVLDGGTPGVWLLNNTTHNNHCHHHHQSLLPMSTNPILAKQIIPNTQTILTPLLRNSFQLLQPSRYKTHQSPYNQQSSTLYTTHDYPCLKPEYQYHNPTQVYASLLNIPHQILQETPQQYGMSLLYLLCKWFLQ